MKKLIIAAGIAASVASFGASALTWTDSSHASVNTTVTGDTYVGVTATPATITLADLNKPGTSLGSFAVSVSGVSSESFSDVVLDDIHAHGYPANGFKVKFTGGMTECEVELGTHDGKTATDNIDSAGETGACKFAVADASNIELTTVASNPTVRDAGVKTITARFRAYKA
ncbi:TPA: hypothetical protein G8O11_003106 [Salmonella enterica]|nr:hypothetical protein [Salmonella enterica]